jgi:uncharacterized cofD-like protein
MADDGGSSGHLRRELGMLPPGDIRNCLVALAEPGNEFARVFSYRFAEGEGLAGHALGNLIIAALADLEGDFATAVKHAATLLGARGRVLPSTLEDVVLSARDAHGNVITGQANVALSEGPIELVCMAPTQPVGYPPALDALRAAELIVLGPGSLYTSLIPNLLVSGVIDAIRESGATVIYVCNVANQRGETSGMDAAGHVDALVAHGLEGAIDVVLVDDAPAREGVDQVLCGPEARAHIEALGIRVLAASVSDLNDPLRHDKDALCRALREVG